MHLPLLTKEQPLQPKVLLSGAKKYLLLSYFMYLLD
nr:MAG TPA: hypothetical protein [Caudoviricetes sp.]